MLALLVAGGLIRGGLALRDRLAATDTSSA
jgi:hypothetical protein